MGVQARYGALNTGAYMGSQPGSAQVAFTDQYLPKWDGGGARGPRTVKDPYRWVSLWSFGVRLSGSGGGSDGDPVIGRSLAANDLFEPYSCDGPGCQFKNRIKGQCLDSGGSPVANAIVQGYVTQTDAYVGEVQANNDGTYELMTENGTSVAHYLVAYKAGTPDIAGTTVNTILPTAS